jgi:hypothetical protein
LSITIEKKFHSYSFIMQKKCLRLKEYIFY